jgi:ribosomal protein L19E
MIDIDQDWTMSVIALMPILKKLNIKEEIDHETNRKLYTQRNDQERNCS